MSGIIKRTDRPSKLSDVMRTMLVAADNDSNACKNWSCPQPAEAIKEPHQSNAMRISQILKRARNGTPEFHEVSVDVQGMRVGQPGGVQRAPRNKF
jgi:hypothetical protein